MHLAQLPSGIARRRAQLSYLFIALVSLLALPSMASASFTPMPVAAVLPANGSALASASGARPFEVDLASVVPITASGRTMYVEVSTQNVPGQDGSLASDYNVDFFALYQSDATPSAYRGTANTNLWATPGVYYWQAKIDYLDLATSPYTAVDWLSPVYVIVVPVPPAPVPVAAAPVVTPLAPTYDDSAASYRMTLADLANDVPGTIAQHARGARNLKRSCTRVTTQTFRCSVNWNDNATAYAGTLRVTDNGSYWSTFTGLRATIKCLRAHAARACAKPFQWRS
jgi:hypothetical protein